MGVKVHSLKENAVAILGDNILVQGQSAVAYYLVPLYNYHVMAESSINNHISLLESAIRSLESNYADPVISLYKTGVISTKKDKVDELIQTCKQWDQFFQIPPQFQRTLKDTRNEFAIMAVKLRTNQITDVESMDIKGILKEGYSQLINSFVNMNQIHVHQERLVKLENDIRKVLRRYAVPVSREMLMNLYVKNLFPSYDIHVDKQIALHDSHIATAVHQEFTPHFGWFEMSNEGVELLGAKRVTTYGSLINIVQFPEMINSDNMNMDIPGLRVVFEVLKKSDAKLMVKQARADIEFEQDSANVAGARDVDLEDYHDLAERALVGLNNDRTLCNMNCYILLLSTDLDDLKTKKQDMLTSLRDVDIIAAVAADQCKEYIQNYIQLDVGKKDWGHLTELRMPISFQLDGGLQVGDEDSEFAAPTIGHDRVNLDM